jgi:hypothetical protein
MARAIAAVLAEPPRPARALLVGSDLPLLGARHLDEALRALDSADVVFGPTLDGGYYLVGAKAPHWGLFDGPRWGTGTVLEETLRLARGLGLRAALISALPDADTAADLRAVLAHARAARLPPNRSLRLIGAWFPGESGAG